jgi:hypothetical protein
LTERSIQCILEKSSTNEEYSDVLSYKADKISGRRLLHAPALRRGGAKFYRVVNWARSLVGFPGYGKPEIEVKGMLIVVEHPLIIFCPLSSLLPSL